jgi:cytochrome c oxidase subunit III
MSEPAAEDAAVDPGAAAAHSVVVPYDPVANQIGMWLFLFTEFLLFGILFLCFGVYLHTYTWQFEQASEELNALIGGFNTLVLLTSSLTVALAIAAMERSNKRLCVGLLNATVLLALTFLVIKSCEWGGKFEHGIYPGSTHLIDDFTQGENIFFGLYFVMTGLHGLHVLIGMALLLIARHKVQRGVVTTERLSWLENAGLYWHLVDLIWIYLFPLFYLIG